MGKGLVDAKMSRQRRFLPVAASAAVAGLWALSAGATSLDVPAAQDLTFGAAILEPQGQTIAVFGQRLSPGPKEGVMVLPAPDGKETPSRIAIIVGPAKRPKVGQEIPLIHLSPDSPQTPEATGKLHSVILPPHGDLADEPRFGVVVIRKGPPLGVGEDNLSYRLCAGPKGPVAEVHGPSGGLLWAADFASKLVAITLPACEP
jgi:hypothetical protein